MDNTLDNLPNEGDTIVSTETRLRRKCEICGEPSHYKQTFLLPNARSNPASNGYHKDDISWCSDTHMFLCKEHRNNGSLDGYEVCSLFPASERFAHMFLYWSKTEQKIELAPTTAG